ncbi:MAG: hypothetical protein ACM3YE_18025 [Bacteroidota bacterium]
MLYAASVKVTFRRNQRRIDVIVNAENIEKATEKAVKQARSIYSPGKKAVYSVTNIISETEALETFQPFPTVENPLESNSENITEE